jgi:signal transduction histidine kinase
VYSTRDGLSSNNVRAITEDRWGRIYFWTGKGVDRLEPDSGAVVHYTTEDGLVPSGSDNQEAFCDRQGNLWFGFNGLSRLEPQPEPAHRKPLPVYVTGIRVDGMRWPTSELGQASLTGLVLQPNQNDLEIEFGTINFDTQRVPRYQYMLEGADKDWSPPTDLRVVNYANMRAGTYRFLVRVVDSEGQISLDPAVVGFRLLAPIWARWWFLSLLVIVVAFAGYRIYRYRLDRLLELERVRTRIASDLHDDIGSGLTQIAILSEVVRQQKSAANNEQLSRIADLSRELVDGMGEIVWALNPQRDQLADLVQRMRRFASDVFVARGIEFAFHAPVADLDAPLRSDVRRQVYLIFKEAINNTVRHSGCTRASISVAIENKELAVEIEDNGEGMAAKQGAESSDGGHGLQSMKRRAADAGGIVKIDSNPDTGTRILLRIPLARSILRERATTT